ncbi:Phosphoinositide phospholipase C 3 [Cardamine amara subsp. amara]|uniref:Phosphoinositide phospholipase C n=1 Tax=Cardamine amara subsp. amara TaxID=228776 RepID=A0ABD0ZU87_CARAN
MSESFKVCFCCSRSFKEKTRQPPVSIKRLFEAYSRNGKMSLDELLRFVSEVQGERHAGLDYVQDIFNSVKHHNVFHPHGLVHLNAFYRYLFSDTNSPLPLSRQAPLSHYFVYTGHNSYLTGNQVNSKSRVEPIVQALRKGVKVIELDLWPNPSGNAAEVRHGGTLTSHEDLQKCLNAIKDNAFHVSDYPVMITLEDHLPPNLQGQVAKMLTKTFRGMLFRCGSESCKHFPSPEELKKKILISTKPPKEYLESQTVQNIRTPMDKETLWSVPANSTSMAWRGEIKIPKEEEEEELESEAVGYRDLIAVHAGNYKDHLKDCLSDDPEKPRRISMNEQWLETVVRTRGTDVVRFTQRNILRIYPKGTRLDSSNYDPLVGWTHGAQMVAFNMQGHGKQLWIMQGMFRANGGCGYVKKPHMLLEQTLFDPCKRLPIKTTLRVKIYTGEGWDLDFPQTHFDQYSPPDFFVKIGIAGVPRDTVSYKTETAVDQWFPIWSNDDFLFQLSVPELALLWLRVQDYDNDTQNDFAGQTCLPLPELKTGVRAVRLHDRSGKAYKNTRLLVSFSLDPPYTFR